MKLNVIENKSYRDLNSLLIPVHCLSNTFIYFATVFSKLERLTNNSYILTLIINSLLTSKQEK